MSAVFRVFKLMGFCFAMIYFASFPLVGWNFLLPGRFSFGVVCLLGLIALGVRAVAAVQSVSTWMLAAYFFMYEVLVLGIGAALDSGALDLKGYFLVGLPLSMIIATMAAISSWCHRPESRITWQVGMRVGGLWVASIVAYFTLQLILGRVELLRFARIQWMLLAVVAAIGLTVKAIEKRQ